MQHFFRMVTFQTYCWALLSWSWSDTDGARIWCRDWEVSIFWYLFISMMQRMVLSFLYMVVFPLSYHHRCKSLKDWDGEEAEGDEWELGQGRRHAWQGCRRWAPCYGNQTKVNKSFSAIKQRWMNQTKVGQRQVWPSIKGKQDMLGNQTQVKMSM